MMRLLIRILVVACVLFWAIDLSFPLFPRLVVILHLGVWLQVYGVTLFPCSLTIGIVWLYRLGMERVRHRHGTTGGNRA